MQPKKRESLSKVASSASVSKTSCEEAMLILLRDKSLLTACEFAAISSAADSQGCVT